MEGCRVTQVVNAPETPVGCSGLQWDGGDGCELSVTHSYFSRRAERVR